MSSFYEVLNEELSKHGNTIADICAVHLITDNSFIQVNDFLNRIKESFNLQCIYPDVPTWVEVKHAKPYLMKTIHIYLNNCGILAYSWCHSCDGETIFEQRFRYILPLADVLNLPRVTTPTPMAYKVLSSEVHSDMDHVEEFIESVSKAEYGLTVDLGYLDIQQEETYSFYKHCGCFELLSHKPDNKLYILPFDNRFFDSFAETELSYVLEQLGLTIDDLPEFKSQFKKLDP